MTMRVIRFPTAMDAHVHFRDGDRLNAVALHTAEQFGATVIMPNLVPHITSVEQMISYRERVLSAIPNRIPFRPLFTLSMTEDLTVAELSRAATYPWFIAVKLYAGHTTNSHGFDDVMQFADRFDFMAKKGIPLLLHGEASPKVEVLYREQAFYELAGAMLVKRWPELKIVCEHITTEFAVDFVLRQGPNVAATITPQHLLSTLDEMVGQGGIRPHMYCLPVLKLRSDRDALLAAATSGNPKFFLGTDSAPHPKLGDAGKAKETTCGCAGTYTAPIALPLYAHAFDSVGALNKLPDFASTFAREFYELPTMSGQTVLTEVKPYDIPSQYEFGKGNVVVPFSTPFVTKLNWRAHREL